MKKKAYYGSIDLTLIGQIVKQQEEHVRKKTLKDGREHKFINISILLDDKDDEYGNIGAVRVDCQKEEQIQSLKYWVGNLKKSKFNQPQSNLPSRLQTNYDDDLGF